MIRLALSGFRPGSRAVFITHAGTHSNALHALGRSVACKPTRGPVTARTTTWIRPKPRQSRRRDGPALSAGSSAPAARLDRLWAGRQRREAGMAEEVTRAGQPVHPRRLRSRPPAALERRRARRGERPHGVRRGRCPAWVERDRLRLRPHRRAGGPGGDGRPRRAGRRRRRQPGGGPAGASGRDRPGAGQRGSGRRRSARPGCRGAGRPVRSGLFAGLLDAPGRPGTDPSPHCRSPSPWRLACRARARWKARRRDRTRTWRPSPTIGIWFMRCCTGLEYRLEPSRTCRGPRARRAWKSPR